VNEPTHTASNVATTDITQRQNTYDEKKT